MKINFFIVLTLFLSTDIFCMANIDALIQKIRAGDVENIHDYISAQDINICDAEGSSLLFYAVSHQREALVSSLLKFSNLDINTINPVAGISPLHVAALFGMTNIVELFLQRRDCKIDITTEIGITPLFSALQNKHTDTIDLLLSCGANLALVEYAWEKIYPNQKKYLESFTKEQ
jgi:ankyrin repeat protein